MKDERFESLSEEVKAKVAACKTADELHALAKSEGVELSLDDLDAASGGWGDPRTYARAVESGQFLTSNTMPSGQTPTPKNLLPT